MIGYLRTTRFGSLRYRRVINNSQGWYYYEIDIVNKQQIGTIYVDTCSVALSWDNLSDKVIFTNIVPESLFKNCQKLSKKQLVHIVNLLFDIGFEGKTVAIGEE